jgi:undecaprenyl-diphosphatase
MQPLWQPLRHMTQPQTITALLPSSPPVRQRTALWAAAIGWTGYLAVVALFLSGKADGIDRPVVRVLRHDGWLWTDGTAHMREAMRDLTALGGTLLLVLVTAAVALVLVALRRRREALALALAAAGAPIFNSVIKAVIDRPRPDVASRAGTASTPLRSTSASPSPSPPCRPNPAPGTLSLSGLLS